MPIYRAQVILPMFTGKARDVVTNTFHFTEDVLVDSDPFITEAISTLLIGFYEDVYPSSASLRCNYIDWLSATVKVANLSDPIPRPIYEYGMAYGSAGTLVSDIPTEVAICASFRAAAVPGIRYQSLYNRVYLGALGGNVIAPSTASSFPVVNPDFVTTVNSAMEDLLTASNTAIIPWRQVGANGFGGSLVPRDIIGGFVDNSPDTQRRRSVDASIKTSWTA